MRGKALKAAFAIAAASALVVGCSSNSGTATDDKKVTIWTSVDQPVLDGLKKSMQPMADAAGITVDWQKVDNINQLIVTKVQAGDVPDIAMIPQPGVVANLVSRDAVFALDDVLDMNSLRSTMVPGTLEAGTVDGKLYGLLTSANVKSLVFYPKKAWAAKGWPIPKTIDELNTLTDTIRNSGETPWCLGIESAAATGWPATDWFEDLVMRYGGPDTYNKWVSHEVKFDSDVVRQAAAEFEKIAFTPGNVLGGRKSIASNGFGAAGNPMFDAKPGCWMYKQGSFITAFFPESVQANLDEEVGVFGFPPVTADVNPVLGGGDLAALFVDTPSGREVMNMLAKPEIGTDAAATSSYISPHKTFPLASYKPALKGEVAKVAYDATAFLFDGSDSMPGEVGSGSFWKEMTAWIAGQQDLDTTLKNIDASWPAS
jgi:alpha-glucoside transport system substrate-binding protein